LKGRRAPRVVILVENLPVPLDRRVWLEATTLRDAGWSVVIISPRGGPGMRRLREHIDGIEVLRYPQRVASGLAGYIVEYPPSLLLSWAWFVWARLRGPIDVIHGCNPPDLFFLFGLAGRAWGARYVFDEHDPNPELSLSKFGGSGLRGRLLYRLTLALEAASYRAADLILTVNETCHEIALRRSGLPAERVLAIRNAPEVERLRGLALGLEPEGRRVGYVGVMGTHDGLDVLLEAWEMVKAQPDMADAQLDLIGDGPARSPLEARLADGRVGSSVHFHGYQSPAVYAPLLARCMVGVSPDPPTPFNHLSSMVKVIDYMAIGRGCVAFDLLETRRLGGDALKVAATPDARGLADALLSVLRDPAEARRLGGHARKRLEELELDWRPYGNRLALAYASLVPAVLRPEARQ
jgi:glycosyltransferase involved in cell wall biosynthesis